MKSIVKQWGGSVLIAFLIIVGTPALLLAKSSLQPSIPAKGKMNRQYQQAMLYVYGKGVSKDYGEAIIRLTPLAEKGHVQAQYNLALRYLLGQGVKRQYSVAVKWLSKAADQGLSDAQYSLGLRYHWGQGVNKDQSKALSCFEQAAKQGHKQALYYKNYLLAQQGLAKAQYDLAQHYLTGNGVEPNKSKALYWLEKAENHGTQEAQHRLLSIREKESEGKRTDAGQLNSSVEKNNELKKNKDTDATIKQIRSTNSTQHGSTTVRMQASIGKPHKAGDKNRPATIQKEQMGEVERYIKPSRKKLDHLKNAPRNRLTTARGTKNIVVELVKQAREHTNAGEIDLAISAYEEALEFVPDSIQIYKKLAKLYKTKRGQDGKSFEDRPTSKYSSDDALNYATIGFVHHQKNDYSKALDEYVKAVNMNPGLGWVYAEMAEIYLKSAKYNLAGKYIKMASFLGHSRQDIWEKLEFIDPDFSNKTDIHMQRGIHLREIVVPTRYDADRIVNLLMDGNDFSQVALVNSLPPFNVNGGYRGVFNEKKLAPHVVQSLKGLSPLALSPVVETGQGFHIFQKLPVYEELLSSSGKQLSYINQ